MDTQQTKGMNNMSKLNLNKYIDICLIKEYADKDFKNGFSLDAVSPYHA
jgi:hypothetical protein